MTYAEAWAAHQKRQNIIPPDEQTFRHGWNAALYAAARLAADGQAANLAEGLLKPLDERGTHAQYDIERRILDLEIDVYT